MAEGRSDPQPGDLIEFDRPGYQHWALYVGDGYVINVTRLVPSGKVQNENAPSLLASKRTILTRRAKVMKQRLKEVVENHKWRVNNKYDHSFTPRPVEDIIWSAEQWIYKEVPYDVLTSNCEHFMTMLCYGKGVSDQAEAALQNINSISSVVTAGIGVASLAVAAGIPVVGLPLLASAAFGAVGSGSLIASIGFTSSNIARSVSFAQFQKAGRDILEQSCC